MISSLFCQRKTSGKTRTVSWWSDLVYRLLLPLLPWKLSMRAAGSGNHLMVSATRLLSVWGSPLGGVAGRETFRKHLNDIRVLFLFVCFLSRQQNRKQNGGKKWRQEQADWKCPKHFYFQILTNTWHFSLRCFIQISSISWRYCDMCMWYVYLHIAKSIWINAFYKTMALKSEKKILMKIFVLVWWTHTFGFDVLTLFGKNCFVVTMFVTQAYANSKQWK